MALNVVLVELTQAYLNDPGSIAGHDISLTGTNSTGVYAASGAAAVVIPKGSDGGRAIAGAIAFNNLDRTTRAYASEGTLSARAYPRRTHADLRSVAI